MEAPNSTAGFKSGPSPASWQPALTLTDKPGLPLWVRRRGGRREDHLRGSPGLTHGLYQTRWTQGSLGNRIPVQECPQCPPIPTPNICEPKCPPTAAVGCDPVSLHHSSVTAASVPLLALPVPSLGRDTTWGRFFPQEAIFRVLQLNCFCQPYILTSVRVTDEAGRCMRPGRGDTVPGFRDQFSSAEVASVVSLRWRQLSLVCQILLAGSYLPPSMGRCLGYVLKNCAELAPELWPPQHPVLRGHLRDPFGCWCRGSDGARDFYGALESDCLPVSCAFATYQPRAPGQTVHWTSFSKLWFARL